MVRDQKETRIGGEGTGMKILYVRDENAVTSIMTEESEKHCSVGWITEQVGKKRVENYWL